MDVCVSFPLIYEFCLFGVPRFILGNMLVLVIINITQIALLLALTVEF